MIARAMYFDGGLIVIDHGESIFTLYMHLSEFLVKEDAVIDKDAPIAKSGSKGRVTGHSFISAWECHQYHDWSTEEYVKPKLRAAVRTP